MAKTSSKPLPGRFRLVSVTVLRPKGKYHYATLAEALDEIRRWVAFGQSVRVFEETFHL